MLFFQFSGKTYIKWEWTVSWMFGTTPEIHKLFTILTPPTPLFSTINTFWKIWFKLISVSLFLSPDAYTCRESTHTALKNGATTNNIKHLDPLSTLLQSVSRKASSLSSGPSPSALPLPWDRWLSFPSHWVKGSLGTSSLESHLPTYSDCIPTSNHTSFQSQKRSCPFSSPRQAYKCAPTLLPLSPRNYTPLDVPSLLKFKCSLPTGLLFLSPTT